jgi:mannose-6-phosphate isomerase-like protein (cupin superfamily)
MTDPPALQRSNTGEIVVTRNLGPELRPGWSDVTSAGIFAVQAQGGRFDRHYHDCDEYWLFFEGEGLVQVGEDRFEARAGDIVCTPAGVEHDVLAVTSTLRGFWFEGATPPGGRVGHLHRSDTEAKGHDVVLLDDLASFDRESSTPHQ